MVFALTVLTDTQLMMGVVSQMQNVIHTVFQSSAIFKMVYARDVKMDTLSLFLANARKHKNVTFIAPLKTPPTAIQSLANALLVLLGTL